MVQQVNELNAGLVAQLESAEILRLMHRLLDVAATHFANEERLLRDRGYPKAGEHRLVHETLIAELSDAVEKFADTPASLTRLAKGAQCLPRIDGASRLRGYEISRLV